MRRAIVRGEVVENVIELADGAAWVQPAGAELVDDPSGSMDIGDSISARGVVTKRPRKPKEKRPDPAMGPLLNILARLAALESKVQ